VIRYSTIGVFLKFSTVKFECNCWGKCCSSFGEFIKVERQITGHDYFCRYGITNELFPVHVLPEFSGWSLPGWELSGCVRNYALIVHDDLLVGARENPSLFDKVYMTYYPLTPGGMGRACTYYHNLSRQCRRGISFAYPFTLPAGSFPNFYNPV
jgi:hypothetical protein